MRARHVTIRPAAGRRGMTLVEVMIAGALSALIAVGVGSLTIQASRLDKSLSAQQVSLKTAQSSIEAINRQIRLATTPLTVIDAGGNPSDQGNRVEFSRLNEPERSRAIELVSDDDDMLTPWDNRLIYDPDTSVSGDEIVLGRWMSPLNKVGAFSYSGATTPLTVQMRAGDPEGADSDASDAYTGPGTQGVEINIHVSPRN